MKVTGFLLLILLVFMACHDNKDHKGKTPLVELSGSILYQEDLNLAMPIGLSVDDSLLFAESYIKQWIEDILLYEVAEYNIPDNEQINLLTENYRKALVVHTYQQALIDQRFSEELSLEELKAYYDSNKRLFIVDQPLIKGLFMKVPKTATGLNNVRNWYKKNTPENVESLEKYSLNNAVSYDYFYDRWTLASDVMDRIPLQIKDLSEYLKSNRHIEFNDEEFYYFLNIEDLLEIGEEKPFEFAQKEARVMLSNQRQVSFMREMKEDLYKKALSRNKIIYYY